MSRIWTQQPQVPVGIDWSNPLTSGLVECYTPIIGDAIAGGNLLIGGSGPTSGVGNRGRSDKYNTGATRYKYRNSARIVSLAECTIVAVVKAVTPSLTTEFCGYGSSASANPLFMLGYSGTLANTVSFRCRNGGGTDQELSAPTSEFIAGEEAVWAGTRSQSLNFQKVYKNGIERNTATATTLGATTFDRWAVGGLLRSSFALASACDMYAAYVFNRALSAPEIKSLSDNPWQLFQPLPSRIWVGPAAASGDVTLYPSLLTNNGTLYSPTVTGTSTSQSITTDLLTNNNTLYISTVTKGVVNIYPQLLSNDNSLYSPTATAAITLLPELDINGNTVYSPSILTGSAVLLDIVTNSSSVYSPTVSIGGVVVTPEITTNSNTVYTPIVTAVGGSQAVTQVYFENTNTVFSQLVGRFNTTDLEFLLAYMEEHLMLSTPEQVAEAVLLALMTDPRLLTVAKFLALK